MEPTDGYERAYLDYLNQEKISTHIAHANKVKCFTRSKGYIVKTDKIDANIILEYTTLNQAQPNEQFLSKEALEIQTLLKRRDQLIKQKLQEANRLEKTLQIKL